MKQLINKKSYLFIPANRLDFTDKAKLIKPDVVIIDLEDSILDADQEKKRARLLLAEHIEKLKGSNITIGVRINSSLEHIALDLDAIDIQNVDIVIIPKVEDSGFVRLIDSYIDNLQQIQGCSDSPVGLIAMIETCRGIINSVDIARSSNRLQALALGSEDLACDLKVLSSEINLTVICQWLSIAAKSAEKLALGFPGSIANFKRLDRLESQLMTAKNMGYSGAFCIHPSQIELINKVFSYSESDQHWASRVVSAMSEAKSKGSSSIQLDGKMIDTPVLSLAQHIISSARNQA